MSCKDVCSKGDISLESIAQMLNDGKSQRQIGKEINRCQGTVWKLIKKLEQNNGEIKEWLNELKILESKSNK